MNYKFTVEWTRSSDKLVEPGVQETAFLCLLELRAQLVFCPITNVEPTPLHN